MIRKLTDLTPIEVAVIDHLYGLIGPLDFNEYLLKRYNEELDRAFREMMQAKAPIAPSKAVLQVLVRRTLNRWHPSPAEVLNPDRAHRAFAGLKGLLIYASEVMVHRDGLLAHLLTETNARRMQGEEGGGFLLKLLVYETLFEKLAGPVANPFQPAALWQPDGSASEQPLPKAQIWQLVQEAVWGDIVGVTEQMSDVLIRARRTVMGEVLLKGLLEDKRDGV
jgi:hypothetical protein